MYFHRASVEFKLKVWGIHADCDDNSSFSLKFKFEKVWGKRRNSLEAELIC